MDTSTIAFLNGLDARSKASNNDTSYPTKTHNDLSDITKCKLMPYQVADTIRLINILVDKKIALDASDPGIGKSYKAAAVCKELNKMPIIVCPKSTMCQWVTTLKYMGCDWYDIVNYDTIKFGKTYSDDNFTTRINSSYLQFNEIKSQYKWSVKSDTIVIFDEVHKCKNYKKLVGRLFMSSKQLINNGIPVLCLSATLIEKIGDLVIPLYLFGEINSLKSFRPWLKKIESVCTNSNQPTDIILPHIIHEKINKYVCRTTIKELGDKFPSNHCCTQEFFLDDYEEVSKAYKTIDTYVKIWKRTKCSNILSKIQKLNQIIELKKVPIFIEQAKIHLKNKRSVIIFVNFIKTLEILADQLKTKCIIRGNQTVSERQQSIDRFQSNVEHIIICQCRAGSVGISLHDTTGNHPRTSLISCPDSASDLLQELGRAVRSGTKSAVLQRLIFVAGVEQEYRKKCSIDKKLNNISVLNDGCKKLSLDNMIEY